MRSPAFLSNLTCYFPISRAADLAWGALRDLLDALSRLPDKYERAGKARKLLATLFPEGLLFLRLPYGEQYVTMDTMLISLMRMFRLGPAVSLKGSPTVSPTTPAL